jgi:transcriptional antiterminator Rof (Rho-off)
MNTDRIDTDYRPIACATYDQYELAILHRHRLHLVWHEGNVAHDRIVTPLNLRTAAGAEFLVVKLEDGEIRELRLDRIRRAETL